MKGVLGWIKSHLIMVISTVVIVVSLPLGWIFSSGMNKDIREKQEQRASQAANQVNSAKVNYVIPSLLPDEPAWSESRVPNEQLTEFIAQEREKRLSQAAEVVSTVIEFNRGEHALLSPDLLPEPTDPRAETRLKYEFLARMAGDRRTNQETIYADLLASIGAGEPPDPVRLAATIQDLRDREAERMEAESGSGTISADQQETLTKLLADRRLAEAQRRAKEVSVYLTLEAFDSQGYGVTSAQIPPLDRDDRPDKTQAPSLAEVFGWNFDYWVASDLLRAIDAANTDAGGLRANVENALVKRVERIAIETLPIQNAGMGGDEEESFGGGFGDDEGMASEGLDPSVSVTGRISNEQYDVINAQMTLVVEAARLPQLFRAFARTNLITVIDMDVTEVDLWADLREGYFYGNEPVVRVDLELETIWHRDWTAPLMPQSVRNELGIVLDGEEDGGEG